MDANKKIDYVLRSMNKCNGILFELTDVNSNMLNVVISKKNRHICFVAYGAMADKIRSNYKIKDRIKIRFYATSKKYNDKWYTSLVVYDVFEWKKNEKKLAKMQNEIKFQEEVEYLRRPKFDWNAEVDKFNKATEKK